ncbi:putative Caspase-1, p20 [Candidatus Nitrospira nitrosa]|uniref:Putative Caspase-1, p20 n=1 Tax=Candidatus Nitrospira nitrosa TaxID=1742972 RepID=A0A0S4L3K3_9BACT|nr:caspase family protein [Candidatus Nitrospira nitrosa]CUS31296.1 putative Caspase-1, p20 [Candidatus Nitrospira nitrosa]
MAKRAVLIGINKYQVPGSDLNGCVNDVKNLSGALKTYYGFADKDITTLTDLKATKKAMQAAIQKLIVGGKKGDTLLLHYSGHGSNVPDDNGDEADHRDEILCPTDLDWKDTLRDDWLRKTFNRLRKGVSLTVIMDCCHSGTITRAILPPDAPVRERFLPCPLDLMATESGRKLRGVVQRKLKKASSGRSRKSDIVDADIQELLITGCRSTQTSADADIGGIYNGALTYYLVESIKEAHGKLTYRELHQRTVAKLKQNDYDQVPQLEGQKTSFDRQFLS